MWSNYDNVRPRFRLTVRLSALDFRLWSRALVHVQNEIRVNTVRIESSDGGSKSDSASSRAWGYSV
jgi:hypothetical protein